MYASGGLDVVGKEKHEKDSRVLAGTAIKIAKEMSLCVRVEDKV